MANKPISLLIFSVDLEPADGNTSLSVERSIRATASELVKLFQKYHIPATWGVNDIAKSARAAIVRDADSVHELAFLGGHQPATTASRKTLANQLTRTIHEARNVDVNVRSIVGFNVAAENTDLLVKNQIFATRSPSNSSRRFSFVSPHAVRYGVWNMPASCYYPARHSWLSDMTAFHYQRMIRMAAARKKTVHMVMDAYKLSQMSNWATGVERLLDTAAKYRRTGQMQVLTLCQAVEGLRVSSSNCTQSVLRRAA
ncbi:MAG: hypothetical protein R3C28_17995 [Pirellulaceae bacterium]